MRPGPRLIAFEGVDGAGKSTVLERVAAALRERGLAVHRPRIGKRHRSRPARRIRDLTRDPTNLDLCPRAELALYCAREAQVLAESVVPALAREEIVLLDRGLLTPVVIGCWGRGLPLADCEAMARAARGDRPAPELTLVFDVDPRTSRQRKQIGKIRGHGLREGGRKGLAGSAFKARIRAGYRELAARDASFRLIVNERDDPEQVTARVLAILDGAPAEPERDAQPWWRIAEGPPVLDRELDAIPERLAIYLTRGLTGARERRARARRREPSLVAWCLDADDPLREELATASWGDPIHALAGLRRVALGADDLRLRCAAIDPVAVARSLVEVEGQAADELRRLLLSFFGTSPTRTVLGFASARSDTLRFAPGPRSDSCCPDRTSPTRTARSDTLRFDRRALAGALVESLAGREDRYAFELRELLWSEADAFERAASLRGCSGAQAEALRAALFEEDPARALDSLRGVDPALADDRLERYATLAPKPVLRALVGRGDPRAHELRELLGETGSEVVESVAGLVDERSFALREATLEAWPLGVVASLRGVPLTDPRARACIERLRIPAATDLELTCALLRLGC